MSTFDEFINPGRITCWKGCELRADGCHGRCDIYKEQKARAVEINRRYSIERHLDSMASFAAVQRRENQKGHKKWKEN